MIVVLYVVEVLLVVGAVPLMFWLRREGDLSWRRHRTMVLAAPITRAFAQMQIVFRDQLTPTMARVAQSLADLAWAFSGTDVVSAELVRLTLGGRPERPELVVPTEAPGEGAR